MRLGEELNTNVTVMITEYLIIMVLLFLAHVLDSCFLLLHLVVKPQHCSSPPPAPSTQVNASAGLSSLIWALFWIIKKLCKKDRFLTEHFFMGDFILLCQTQ